ncbi:MAG: helicase-related protein [Byssovorax sp.]
MQEILPGTEVLARGLRWEVVHVQPSADASLFRLRCQEGALRGQEIDLVSPFETVEPVATPIDPTKAGQLAPFRVYHDAFLLEQALGPHALLAAQPGRLKIQAYQLVPIMRALGMPRPRLLIADDVGLGKTIEAGLVLAELIARRRAHRVLIVSPAGPLMAQWQRELRHRFGLRFRAIDGAALQDIRHENELGANPFDQVALGITSLQFARQDKVIADIERSHFDVVIIDEAHHVAKLGTAGERGDSQQRKLAEVLAERADALLLLTATPHDGFDPHFASLLDLLDPSLLDGSGSLRGDRYRAHIIRRLKRHIMNPETGLPLFRERQLVPHRIDFSARPRFSAFQTAMLSLIVPPLRRALKRKSFGDALAFIALLKRSVSTVKAAASTLLVVEERLGELMKKKGDLQEERRQRIRTLRDLVRRSERFGSLSFEEEQDLAALEAEDIASELLEAAPGDLLETLRRESRREHDRLRQIKDTKDALAELSRLAADAALEDPKLDAVLAEIRAIRAAEPNANVLVYTEYSNSQEAVVHHLQAALGRGELGGTIESICGDDDEKDRERVTAAFTGADGIVLVSTDASAEGLNLHERCHHLIHIELPYNPNRLEQRNGRIDRYGQQLDPIIRYLYLAGTFEEKLLHRLVDKYEKQRKTLGFMPNTLGLSATELGSGKLLEGLADEQGGLFARVPDLAPAVPSDDEASPAVRDLFAEMDKVFESFERTAKTKAWLGESGVAADAKTLHEAAEAQRRGSQLGAVDLTDFVRDAVRADSADPKAVTEEAGGILALKLPDEWLFGLDEMPGFDVASKTLRITRQVDQVRDGADRPLAYLGRAHPIVRRALDRVRNVRFGGSGHYLDRRVAAIRGDGGEPEVLYTFLGQVRSRADRELERVIAVRMSRTGAFSVLVDAAAWSPLLAAERALPPAGVWDAHFKSWAQVDDARARASAGDALAELGRAFVADHRMAMETEERDINMWLNLRAKELCGDPAKQGTLQMGLFGDGPAAEAPRYKTLSAAIDRLAALASDAAVPARLRGEAQAVLRLHKDRAERVAQRSDLEAPRLIPLGLLLLVPQKGAGRAS